MLKDYKKAIQDYTTEILKSKAVTPRTYNNRAYCYTKLEKYVEAIADYTKTIEMDSANLHAIHNRGLSYMKIQEYEKAIQDFISVIKLDEGNANAYFNRGCCYDAIREFELSIQDYSKALALDKERNKKQAKTNINVTTSINS